MSEDATGAVPVPTAYERLAERFPAEDHKTRKQGGRDLTYLPGEKVIARLNAVLRFDWSFRVVNQGATEVEAWVLGELSATIDGVTVTRQQYGNQDLARGQHATTDLYKSAATDSLKKCATTIGVGLYLYDEDERREVEAEMRQAKQAPRRPQTSDKVHDSAVLTGADPTPLKTKVELAADVRTGIEYARSLGLDPVDVDCGPLNRAEIESVLDSLRQQCIEARRVAKASS